MPVALVRIALSKTVFAMSVRISVQKLAEVLGPAFQAVDIRVAATKENGVWTNALGTVRLTRESPSEILDRHKKLEQLHGKVFSEHFRIVCSALPFCEWGSFLHACDEGHLRVGDTTINWTDPVKVCDQLGYVQPYYHQLRGQDSQNWPSFESCCGRYHQERLGTEELNRELSAIGWSSPNEAINALCEMNTATGTPHAFDFCIGIPVFALVDRLAVRTTDDQLIFRYQYHKQIKGLNVLGRVKLRTNSVETIRTRLELAIEEHAAESQIVVASGRATLKVISDEELLELKITHDQLGELYSVQSLAQRLIPEAEQNILYAALRKFCPGLENLLVRPHMHKPKRLKTSSAFELHVSWILSLSGLSPAVLGEYEQLFAEQTGVERASVDILAASAQQNALVVAACTMGTPKEDDFSNLAHACEILRREVFSQTSVIIFPVIFTGAVGQPSYRELGDVFATIPIIDADRLAIVVELLNAHMQRFVLDFIGNPQFCELRSPTEK